MASGLCKHCGNEGTLIRRSKHFAGYCMTCYKREFAKQKYREQHGEVIAQFAPWEDDELDVIRQRFQTATPQQMTAALPGRTWNAIRRKAFKMGVHRERLDKFKTRERDICRVCGYEDRLTVSVEFPGLCQSCYNREYARRNRQQRGAIERAKVNWLDEEMAVLQSLWGMAEKAELLAALPDKTWGAIRQQARDMRIGAMVDAVERAAIQAEPARSLQYWHDWALGQSNSIVHPAIADLIKTERRILASLY